MCHTASANVTGHAERALIHCSAASRSRDSLGLVTRISLQHTAFSVGFDNAVRCEGRVVDMRARGGQCGQRIQAGSIK
jgi:hypothetical protein